jgi:hypothetical protein
MIKLEKIVCEMVLVWLVNFIITFSNQDHFMAAKEKHLFVYSDLLYFNVQYPTKPSYDM